MYLSSLGNLDSMTAISTYAKGEQGQKAKALLSTAIKAIDAGEESEALYIITKAQGLIEDRVAELAAVRIVKATGMRATRADLVGKK